MSKVAVKVISRLFIVITSPPSLMRTTRQFGEKGRVSRILVAAGGKREELHVTPTHAGMHHGKYSRWLVPAPHPTCATLGYGGTAGAPRWKRPNAVIDPRYVQVAVLARRGATQSTGAHGHRRRERACERPAVASLARRHPDHGRWDRYG
jgi:hypothetical protein